MGKEERENGGGREGEWGENRGRMGKEGNEEGRENGSEKGGREGERNDSNKQPGSYSKRFSGDKN